MVAGSGSIGYCDGVNRHSDRDLPLLTRPPPRCHRGLPRTAPATGSAYGAPSPTGCRPRRLERGTAPPR